MKPAAVDQMDKLFAEAFALSMPNLDAEEAKGAGEIAGTYIRTLDSLTRCFTQTAVAEGADPREARERAIFALTAVAATLLYSNGKPPPRLLGFARSFWMLKDLGPGQRGRA